MEGVLVLEERSGTYDLVHGEGEVLPGFDSTEWGGGMVI